jgi:CheY-like chemotaxis protein
VRVLVVEDDPDGREALVFLLTYAGAQVTSVGSTRAALDAISAAPPDVLVSDIGLPFEDGYALIEKVRAFGIERGGAIPAVAVTAYTRAQDRARALDAGYQAYVPKPLDPAALISILAAFFRADG